MKKFILFLFITSIFSCKEKTNECNTCDEEIKIEVVTNEELVMYEPSELAALMQEMYDENKNWKAEIMKGNIPKGFPEKYKTIHSAESTNENAGSAFYNGMASSYIQTIEDLTNATPENVQERYNTMVNVCVRCHLTVCPGPVVRIKKLLITE
tara:strand:- start:297 stop:755 length:459 start_codon:yes stop_codon:yes gene_type:complete